MIHLYGMLLMMAVSVDAMAQDTVSQPIDNAYIDEANRITEVSEVNRLSNELYREKFGEDQVVNLVTDIPPNGAYYRIAFKKTPYLVDTGLLDIWHRPLADDSASIEQLVERYYGLLKGDNDEQGYFVDYVKDSAKQAGFFFDENGHALYIVMCSPQQEFVMATIEMNLTTREKMELARDFIRKTRFVGG